MTPIYLDYNATTPIDPRDLEAMLPYPGGLFGNPPSNHALGRRARDAVEAARAEVANLVGASPREMLFTSGAPRPITSRFEGLPLQIRPVMPS
jgi:cysteine desulfurase